MARENRTELCRLRITKREAEQLDRFAESRGWTRSQAVRAAIARMVSESHIADHFSAALIDASAFEDAVVSALSNARRHGRI